METWGFILIYVKNTGDNVRVYNKGFVKISAEDQYVMDDKLPF
jgi:hypothetical protein